MTTTTEQVVGPELAAQWLTRNHPQNRHRDPARVALYARAMLAGQWLTTGESVKFSAVPHTIPGLDPGTPVLIDGQHRLAAVACSGVPVLLSVTTGVPVEAMLHMDSGKSRNVTTRLRMVGVALGTHEAAICQSLYQLGHRGINRAGTDPSVIRAIYTAWGAHIDAMMSNLGFSDGEGRPTRGAPTLSALALTRWLAPPLIDALADRINTGQADARGEADPARAIRRRIAPPIGGASRARFELSLHVLRACEAELDRGRLSSARGTLDTATRVLERLRAAGAPVGVLEDG